MFEDRKLANIFLRLLHLGVQIIAGYWAVNIEGYDCKVENVHIISYIGYALFVLNIVLYFMLYRGTDLQKPIIYAVLGINLALVIAVIILAAQGYNHQNSCATNKVFFEFFFIVGVVGLLLSLAIMFANLNWAERYSNWIGNIAWPILFLATEFEGSYKMPTLIIGIVTAIICASSFILNIIAYNSIDLTDKKKKMMTTQWTIGMVLLFICEVYAIIVLISVTNGGDYRSQQARKSLVVFAGVNIIDMCFWAWGYSRMSIWAGF